MPLLDDSQRRLNRRTWVALLGYTACVFLVCLGDARTLTGHESILVEISREMVQTGNWLVPRLGGQPFLEKPPLPHWIVACLIAVLGEPTEWLVRLPSVLVGMLGVALTASLAARWLGPTLGLLAGLMQATTIYTLTYARLAESDVYLWVIVLAALWVFAREHVEPRTPWPHGLGRLAFLTLVGLSNLVKGPLFGAVLIIAPCVVYLLLERRWRELRWFLHVPGLIVAVVLAIGWPLAVFFSYPESLDLWLEHTVGRLQDDTARNPKPLWYYLTTLPWQTLPWTLLPLLVLPVVLRKAWCERTHHQRFLVLWLLVMLIVLSLASGKHHHYLIYALPPISLWAAQGLVRLRQLLQGLENRKLHVAALACALTLSVSGTALAMAWRWPEWTGPIAVLASLVHLALLAPLLGLHVQRLRAGVVIGFLALAASVGVVHGTVMPVLDTYTTETQFLHRLAIRSAKAGPLLVYKVDPARVAVYTRLRTEFFDDLDLLERRSLELPSALVVTSVQREASLARVGEPEELDRVTPPGRRQRDPSLHLAVYRMTWRERPESMARNP